MKKHSRSNGPGAIITLSLYIILAICITYPIAWQLGTAVPGSEGDVWVHLWTFNWVKQALLSGQSPFYTSLIFFPQGASLLTHNFAWLHIALWLPLQALIGLGAAYSLLFLATFAFNGFTTYLFALELRFSRWAAFVSGLIVAFYPYILSHHDHPNLIVVGWVPLALLFLQRTISQQRRRDTLWAALCLALLGITRWQLLFFATPLIAIFVLYELAHLPAPQRRQPIRLLLLTAATTTLLLTPILLIILRGAQISTADLQVTDELFSQADLLGYILPSRYHPWWGEAAFRTFYGNLHNSDVFITFVGYTTLGLLLYGLRQHWHKARLWLIIGLVYLLLALGPELLVNGRSLLPLPYALLKNTLIDVIVRRPARFNLFLALPVALLAGQGIERIWQQQRQSARLLTLGCIALILLEYQVHYPTLPLTTPAWYSQLAQEPGSFGILELPMHNRVYDEDYLFYQFTHGKPLVGGHVSRPPTAVFTFIHSLPLLQNTPDSQEPPTSVADVGNQLRQLAEANVRYLILHKQQLGVENLQKWQTWLALTPVHEDDELVVYQTAVRVGQDTPWQPTGIDGLGVVTGSVVETAVSQNSTLNLHLRWGSQTPLTQNHDVCFLLLAASSTPSQRTCQPISTQWPTSQWPANQLLDAHYQLLLDPYLPSGSYRVAASVGDQTPMPLGTITLTAHPRAFASDPTAPACASWANRIILRDYTISQPSPDSLTLQLTWLAQSRMTTSYKLFIHLISQQTGELVRQSDTIPNNWGYPTTWWEQNELISDTLTLPTANLPPGRYQLRLGWYDAATLERLNITPLTCPLANIENQSLRLQTIEQP